MSWDIFVQDIPRDAKSVGDIPDDFTPSVLGTRAQIIRSIERVVPGADFSRPEWGRIEAADHSIEVDMGDDEMCQSFALHVRGGPSAAFVVHEILEELGLRGFDPSNESGIFSLDAGSLDGLAEWRAYGDHVLGDDRAP